MRMTPFEFPWMICGMQKLKGNGGSLVLLGQVIL